MLCLASEQRDLSKANGSRIIYTDACSVPSAHWFIDPEGRDIQHRSNYWINVRGGSQNPSNGTPLVLGEYSAHAAGHAKWKIISNFQEVTTAWLRGTTAAASAAPVIAMSGRWKQMCTSGRTCTLTTEKSYTFSKEFADSYTKGVEKSIEAGLSVSTTVAVEGKAGPVTASASTTLSASLTTGLSEAVTKARNTTAGSSEGLKQTFECPLTVPVGKLGFLWQQEVAIGNNTAFVLNCLDACNATVPTWDPGSVDHITSCN